MTIERLENPGGDEILPLIEESRAEGFDFLQRLKDEYASGANRFDKPGEAIFGVRDAQGRLVAVGGLNRDPFQDDPNVGRLRRVYVRPSWRRRGLAARLVATVLEAARAHFNRVQLRSTEEAMEFYRVMGFGRVQHLPQVTHVYPFGPLAEQLRELRLGPVTLSTVNSELPCLVLEHAAAERELRRLRAGVMDGIVAFLGAYHEIDRWHPQRLIVPQRELILGPGSHPFDCLRLADTVNHAPADLMTRLEDWHGRFGLEVTLADRSSLSFRLHRLPPDLRTFVEELYDFCPNPVDAGWVQTKEYWVEQISEYSEVYLYW